MVNVEVLLVDWLAAHPDILAEQLSVHMDVPSKRPARFVTVERTGGPVERFRDVPMLSVQVWATYRFEAADLAKVVAAAIRQSVALPTVARVNIVSIGNNPHPDSKQARYQVVCELVTKDN